MGEGRVRLEIERKLFIEEVKVFLKIIIVIFFKTLMVFILLRK